MLQLIYKEIVNLKDDVCEIKKEMCELNIAVLKLTPALEHFETNPKELPSSFKIDLPITDKAEFERFDRRLETDKPLQHSLVRIHN